MKECTACNLCFDDAQNHCPNDGLPLYISHNCGLTLSDRYVLEQRLGKGGMGAVYRAKHKFLKSLHAIKIISPEVVKEDETLLVRFRQEAILAASIHHPNVVNVTDFGVENEDTPFLVMEYIEGISLADYLRRQQRLSAAKALEILEPIILGVGEAHKRGITHRDLKPLNVMLRDGRPLIQAVKVLDFGLAKIKSTESFASLVQAKTTSLLGSPQYMSPEQWANENIDTRTDIYSLGILLFQMLTGDVPFQGDSIPTIMYQHLQSDPPSFESLGIPASLHVEAVIKRALAKKQDDRLATVEEFLYEYKRALSGNVNQVTLNLNNKEPDPFHYSLQPTHAPLTKAIEKDTDKTFDKSYNLPYLTLRQNETLSVYFNQPKSLESKEEEDLAEEFIQAQNRVVEARTKVSEAEKLAEEFNQAQKVAENARHKVLEARMKLEEDMRRRMQGEMASKLEFERKARETAEAEAQLLMEEVKTRKVAEERANALAKTALEAQQRAEQERQKAEIEVHQQRQLEEITRQKAEEAALKLAQEVVEAKKRYDQAKHEAVNEAHLRLEAELKRTRIEEEIQQIKANETYKRKTAEAEAQLLIEEVKARKDAEERANALAKTAFEAQNLAEQERQKAEREIQHRHLEESTRQKAEEAALKLGQEVVDAKKRYDEAKNEAANEAHFRLEAEIKGKRIEEEIQQIKETETLKRKIVEEQAAQQIKEQAGRLEKQAFEAQQRANEARILVGSEVQKREQAESARIKAEQEVRRLAEEIIEGQTRLEEAQLLARSESEKRILEQEKRRKAEESARLSSLQNQQNLESFNKNLEIQTLWANSHRTSSPDLSEETSPQIIERSAGNIFVNTSPSDVMHTHQISGGRSFRPLILVISLFAFLFVGGFGGFLIYYFSINSSTVGNASGKSKGPNDTSRTDGVRRLERVNKKMVQITGGTFQMGRSDVKPSVFEFGVQFPSYPASVDDYYIDRTEVTNAEYDEFIKETGHKAPENWQNRNPPPGLENFPVTYISNFDARDFAEWLSKRDNIRCQLPTEEEWEYAARSGNQQNIYPWGNEWIPGRVNIGSGVPGEGVPGEVGTTGDETSAGGIKDMMGNVLEWTFTTFKYYPNFPKADEDPNINANIFLTARGSSFAATKRQIDNRHFLLTSRRGYSGETKVPYLGFRLVCRP